MNTNTRQENAQQGFTLIEILVVLALIALVTALAWPKSDTQSRLPGQFGEALASYLNAAGAAADNRQSEVCVQKSAGQIVMTPNIQSPLRIPKDIETDFNNLCFGASGNPQSPVNIGIRHVKDTSNAVHITSEGIYGRIRVSE